jgi:hypothetical protein
MIADVGFEYKLFQPISQDFPVVEFLYIDNSYRMKDKEDSLTSITFPHVTLVDLKHAHVDYAELFLLKKKASTSFVKSLHQLQITHNDNKQFYQ